MVIFGILIPFIGTSIGAFLVYFVKKDFNNNFEKILLGFASGVMVAASVFSLILPAIELVNKTSNKAWLIVSLGFLTGIAFLLLLDKILPNINLDDTIKKNEFKKLGDYKMLFLAVTLHNIPEGMAVGVAFASYLSGNEEISLISALVLAIGIAIQNFPEGAIVSLPLKSQKMSKTKAFLYGVLSGVVEPIAAVITIALTGIVVPILPFLLSTAAGAMIYVVVDELLPKATNNKNNSLATIGLALGFVVMMILDITLG